MINTTDKGPVFKQKYQVGVEPNIIDRYVKRYEEEQPIESIIHVAKNNENKKVLLLKVKAKVMHSLIQKGYTIETAICT